jgi:hypothetical protein
MFTTLGLALKAAVMEAAERRGETRQDGNMPEPEKRLQTRSRNRPAPSKRWAFFVMAEAFELGLRLRLLQRPQSPIIQPRQLHPLGVVEP